MTDRQDEVGPNNKSSGDDVNDPEPIRIRRRAASFRSRFPAVKGDGSGSEKLRFDKFQLKFLRQADASEISRTNQAISRTLLYCC